MTPELTALRATVDDALNHYLPEKSDIGQPVVDAMRYTVLSGGKRIRPMLVCAACTGLGGKVEDALAPACAIEFVHAYSLIHDDLPVMDDDELRHGLPSNHVKFGEATAVLAGDALQALAFETLAKAPTASDAVRLRGVQLLAEAAGWNGMVGGQSYDLESERKKLGLNELKRLHAAKTGALITAAVQLGALFGHPRIGAESYVLMTEFATRVGLAFQVIDDVLDVTRSTEELGKPANSDTKARKSTYPALLGVSAARKMADEILAEGLKLLRRAELRHDLLQELARLVVSRSY